MFVSAHLLTRLQLEISIRLGYEIWCCFLFDIAARKPEFRQVVNTTTFQQMNEAYRRLNAIRNGSTGDMALSTSYPETGSRKSRSITLPVTLERSMGLENGSPMDVTSNMQETHKQV